MIGFTKTQIGSDQIIILYRPSRADFAAECFTADFVFPNATLPININNAPYLGSVHSCSLLCHEIRWGVLCCVSLVGLFESPV